MKQSNIKGSLNVLQSKIVEIVSDLNPEDWQIVKTRKEGSIFWSPLESDGIAVFHDLNLEKCNLPSYFIELRSEPEGEVKSWLRSYAKSGGQAYRAYRRIQSYRIGLEERLNNDLHEVVALLEAAEIEPTQWRQAEYHDDGLEGEVHRLSGELFGKPLQVTLYYTRALGDTFFREASVTMCDTRGPFTARQNISSEKENSIPHLAYKRLAKFQDSIPKSEGRLEILTVPRNNIMVP